ncbi:sperm-associated antigen 7 [Alligator sinensis]|uniref:Sperm-associated antigen 7 n=1 Tax=Alligator sinensis TaxID=38654 RepID=A0A1U8DAD3_ALLSI|nr:sperm-associated antigen 7 [Alligator sinensis]
MAELDLLGSILSAMERPPGLGDQEARRRARGQGSRRGRTILMGLLPLTWQEAAAREAELEAARGPAVVSPQHDYKDKYSHLIGTGGGKGAAHAMEANKAYGCVPVANKRDTRSIEEAMNEIRAKKRLRQSEDDTAGTPAPP